MPHTRKILFFIIAELKERCAKKGLDFDTENQKVLDKRAKKAARKAARKQKVNK